MTCHRHRERLKQKSRDCYALTRNGKEKERQKARNQIPPESTTPTTGHLSISMSSGGNDDSESIYSPSGELMPFLTTVFVLTVSMHCEMY